jgi:hypothetical protein
MYVYFLVSKTFKQASSNATSNLCRDAESVEKEKLRAIGMYQAIDNEVEDRIKRETTLEARLKVRHTQLKNFNEQYHSLLQVISVQESQINKIQNT